MKNLHYLFVSVILSCLINQAQSTAARQCQYQSGCYDSKGRCTNQSCQEVCSSNSDCFFNCCLGGYCKFDECDQNKAIQIITIVVPVVFGSFILIVIVCCIIKRRRLQQQKQVAQLNQNFSAQQAAINNQYLPNNQQDMNKMMEMQQMQLQQQQFGMQQQQQFGMQQQQFGMQQQPLIMQANIYNPNQQQGLIVTNTQNPNQSGMVSYI